MTNSEQSMSEADLPGEHLKIDMQALEDHAAASDNRSQMDDIRKMAIKL